MIEELKLVQAVISLWVFISFTHPSRMYSEKHGLPHRFIASIKSALLNKIYCSWLYHLWMNLMLFLQFSCHQSHHNQHWHVSFWLVICIQEHWIFHLLLIQICHEKSTSFVYKWRMMHVLSAVGLLLGNLKWKVMTISNPTTLTCIEKYIHYHLFRIQDGIKISCYLGLILRGLSTISAVVVRHSARPC